MEYVRFASLPQRIYLISKPLELPSDFRLVLPRFAEIRLADGSDCVMLKNKTVRKHGPITHIDINRIYAEGCHSAIRLLTVQNPVEHIHISDVHGTYYQYCIGITKYYEGET